MDSAAQAHLARLIRSQRVASIGTLRQGSPLVSLVVYAESADMTSFLIHVSRLAQHTQDLLADQRVSLMIAEPDNATVNPQQLARLSIQGEAVPIEEDSSEFREAAERYLKKFPQNAMMFGLGDFILYRIVPKSMRFVAGFGQIFNLGVGDLRDAAMSESQADDSNLDE